MKTEFEKLQEKREEMNTSELMQAVDALTNDIVDNSDEWLISVSKGLRGYGTWVSSGFANEYHYGDVLAKILTKALSGKITHDEDRDFSVGDFREEIADGIYEELY